MRYSFLFILPSLTFAKVSFNEDVRPIISKNCLACHGPDEEDRKADFHLDTFAGLTKKNDDGQAGAVSGDPLTMGSSPNSGILMRSFAKLRSTRISPSAIENSSPNSMRPHSGISVMMLRLPWLTAPPATSFPLVPMANIRI
ncbi:hypothetical protein N8539_00800 [Akkermansiaceae bacterium]|nr:hypothetical protein [Akkermansiaceae bacterium]MDA7916963.1 hypothetical protein [Akkermansiaceae bacterium]MDB4271545.1 hypothetical protein [Akkermansiaceae bacterium]MDB4283294.1 hypothetical protein [Akkermansiaceae bacterium]MDB4781584.1 hypothetical protein [Akkermansiaceae bacterium]